MKCIIDQLKNASPETAFLLCRKWLPKNVLREMNEHLNKKLAVSKMVINLSFNIKHHVFELKNKFEEYLFT
jgi:hypothetical protein